MRMLAKFVCSYIERLQALSIHKQLLFIFSLFFIGLLATSGFVIHSELRSASRHQSDTIGLLISQQTANVATDILVTGDRLSLSVLLNQLVQTPYVAKAAIYSIDNRLIASSESDLFHADSGQTYSSPIHYQDVIAGYVRLQLDEKLLTKNARDALTVITAIGFILLITSLIFLHLYATGLTSRIALVLRQLKILLKTDIDKSDNTGNELSKLSKLVERELTCKQAIASQSRIEDEPEDNEPEEETSVVVCIRNKNLGRLRQLLSHQDLMEIIHSQTMAVERAAEQYHGEMNYTPEGNTYIRFSSIDSDSFAQDALNCSVLIESLNRVIGQHSVAKIQMGIGVCVSDGIHDFPGDESPNKADSAAGNALMLASLPQPDGVHLFKEQLNWFPAELPVFSASEHDEYIVHLSDLIEYHKDIITRQAYDLSKELERE